MNSLRVNPPKHFGSMAVSAVLDLAKPESGLPPTDGVVFYLTGQGQVTKGRVIVRPSGTEPKIKCYLEVVVQSTDLIKSRQAAQEEIEKIARDAKPLLTGGN